LPVPTISLDAQLKIVELLNTKDCVLPCYLSITPGTTTWKDAKSLLDAIGAEYTGQSQQGDMIWFGYGMHRGNATNVLNQNADSLFDLDLVVDDNGIVQQVFAWFLTHNAGHLLADYWTKNSPRNLFLQIGMPDAIYSTKTAGGLAVVYQKLGVVGIYDSLWNGSFLCPENETRLSNMSFMLTNTAFPLDIYPPNGKVTQYPSLWLPIEKTLHVSNQQFYNQVLSNPLVCFELRP